MATCPECGSLAPDSFGECPTCGGRIDGPNEVTGETAACRRCGEEISTESEACPACGDLHADTQCAIHADRNADGQCVICGNAVCSECNKSKHRHYLCSEHCDVPVVQGWAQVYTTADDLQAHLIKDNLQAEGVDARVLSQKDHFSLPVDFGDLSPVRVLVPAYSYSDAASLIAEHMDDSGEVSFAEDDEAPTA